MNSPHRFTDPNGLQEQDTIQRRASLATKWLHERYKPISVKDPETQHAVNLLAVSVKETNDPTWRPYTTLDQKTNSWGGSHIPLPRFSDIVDFLSSGKDFSALTPAKQSYLLAEIARIDFAVFHERAHATHSSPKAAMGSVFGITGRLGDEQVLDEILTDLVAIDLIASSTGLRPEEKQRAIREAYLHLTGILYTDVPRSDRQFTFKDKLFDVRPPRAQTAKIPFLMHAWRVVRPGGDPEFVRYRNLWGRVKNMQIVDEGNKTILSLLNDLLHRSAAPSIEQYTKEGYALPTLK
jgi:hypothetical protein